MWDNGLIPAPTGIRGRLAEDALEPTAPYRLHRGEEGV
ncbi:hypothetical protein SBA2_180005 [Acidobacteriia bacterium SbA2]|nr:hypothetical protein SBA2_180005 [Acidobacteriia bacterium SbA2]